MFEMWVNAMSRRSHRPLGALLAALLASVGFVTSVSGSTPVTTIQIGESPHRIVVDAADRVVYIGQNGALGGDMIVMDADTGAIIGQVPLPGLPGAMVLDPAGGAVLVATNGSSAIARVLGRSLTLGQPIASPYRVSELAIDPALNRLFVMGQTPPQQGPQQIHLVAIDLSTGITVANRMVDAFGSMVVDSAAGRLYATSGSLSVSVFDTDLIPITTIATATRADTLALDPALDHLFVLGSDDGDVHQIIDTTNDAVVGSLPSTGAPLRIAVDPSRGRTYVTNSSYPTPPSHLDIYEAETFQETVALGTQGADIGVDTPTGNVWVTDEFDGTVTVVGTLTVADPDVDGDGTIDTVDADGGTGSSPAGSFTDDTGDGHVTVGTIVDAAGLSIAISDATDPDGVRVAVGAGTGQATLSVCGGFTIQIDAGSAITITCGSVTLEVATGSARVVLGGGLTVVAIPADGAATVVDTGGETFSVSNVGQVGGPAVTLTVDGVSTSISPGTTRIGASWDFVGFSQPIDNLPTVNQINAGQAVPVKWRILTASGSPVTDLTTATITATSVACENSASLDLVEETTAGDSGLKNLGNGYYQLNWKSPKAYASSCKTLHLHIGDGVSHDAGFKFKK